jgi:hypothetical protein
MVLGDRGSARGIPARGEVPRDGASGLREGNGGGGMSQSSTIAAYLLGGFVIFITMKKELPKYAAVIGIGKKD